MTKLLLLVVALILVVGFPATGEVNPPIDPEALEIIGIGYDRGLQKVREMDDDRRKHVLSELKRFIATDPITAELNKDLLRQKLFILRDEEVIREDVRSFLEGRGTAFPWVYEASKEPRYITLLAPALLRQVPLVDERAAQEPSNRVTTIILCILESTPEFTPAVNQWAYDRRKGIFGGPVEAREIMRRWWKANEQFFKEGNYKAVQPGPSVEKAPTQAASPAQEVPPATPASSATGTPAATLAKTPELASEKQFTPWLWIVGILALLGLGALAWKRRSN